MINSNIDINLEKVFIFNILLLNYSHHNYFILLWMHFIKLYLSTNEVKVFGDKVYKWN
jgi:hypothetical protein